MQSELPVYFTYHSNRPRYPPSCRPEPPIPPATAPPQPIPTNHVLILAPNKISPWRTVCRHRSLPQAGDARKSATLLEGRQPTRPYWPKAWPAFSERTGPPPSRASRTSFAFVTGQRTQHGRSMHPRAQAELELPIPPWSRGACGGTSAMPQDAYAAGCVWLLARFEAYSLRRPPPVRPRPSREMSMGNNRGLAPSPPTCDSSHSRPAEKRSQRRRVLSRTISDPRARTARDRAKRPHGDDTTATQGNGTPRKFHRTAHRPRRNATVPNETCGQADHTS